MRESTRYNLSKTENAVKEPTSLILMELYEALEGVVNMLETRTPPYVQKVLDKYEEKYGKNSSRGTN